MSGSADVAKAEGVGTGEEEACVETGAARDERFVGEAGTRGHRTSWSPMAESGEIEILESSVSQQKNRWMSGQRTPRPPRMGNLPGVDGLHRQETGLVTPFIVWEG